MKTKWYAWALLSIFIFLAAIQENTCVPNQEIVLEFVNLNTTEKDIDKTIFNVTERLVEAGASNINVQETENGALKISYFSIVNVANIKKKLLKDNVLDGNDNPFKDQEENYPLSDNESNYNIDVYELSQESEISDFDGNSILEIKYDSHRYTNTQTFASINTILENKANNLFKIAYRLNKKRLIIADNTSNKIPEVRAGPFS